MHNFMICLSANVNRLKFDGDYKHFEMHREREQMEAARRGAMITKFPVSFYDQKFIKKLHWFLFCVIQF